MIRGPNPLFFQMLTASLSVSARWIDSAHADEISPPDPSGGGEIVVRGSAPTDSVFFLDTLSMPRLYHFGGLTSVINSDLLDGIDFYPGNFSVKFGRAAGGAIDVRTREPKTAIACTPTSTRQLIERINPMKRKLVRLIATIVCAAALVGCHSVTARVNRRAEKHVKFEASRRLKCDEKKLFARCTDSFKSGECLEYVVRGCNNAVGYRNLPGQGWTPGE